MIGLTIFYQLSSFYYKLNLFIQHQALEAHRSFTLQSSCAVQLDRVLLVGVESTLPCMKSIDVLYILEVWQIS